jgi:hypothetical protein
MQVIRAGYRHPIRLAIAIAASIPDFHGFS